MRLTLALATRACLLKKYEKRYEILLYMICPVRVDRTSPPYSHRSNGAVVNEAARQ